MDHEPGRITKKETWFSVAVWWPGDGAYGGIQTFPKKEDALAERQNLLKLRYKIVDVWKTTREPIHGS